MLRIPAEFVRDFTIETAYVKGTNLTPKGVGLRKAVRLKRRGVEIGTYRSKALIRQVICNAYIKERKLHKRTEDVET